MTVNTNIQITNTGASHQARTPKTIGFSFAPGDWHPQNSDIYADRLTDGTAVGLPIQTDSISTHQDGSVRFAVLSLDAGALDAGQGATVRLATGPKRAPYAGVVADTAPGLVAKATIYGVQRTEARIGPNTVATVLAPNGAVFTLRLTANGTSHDYTMIAGDEVKAPYPEPYNGVVPNYGRIIAGLALRINNAGIFRARREGNGVGANARFCTLHAVDGGLGNQPRRCIGHHAGVGRALGAGGESDSCSLACIKRTGVQGQHGKAHAAILVRRNRVGLDWQAHGSAIRKSVSVDVAVLRVPVTRRERKPDGFGRARLVTGTRVGDLDVGVDCHGVISY
jgi:hypothetical protein